MRANGPSQQKRVEREALPTCGGGVKKGGGGGEGRFVGGKKKSSQNTEGRKRVFDDSPGGIEKKPKLLLECTGTLSRKKSRRGGVGSGLLS